MSAGAARDEAGAGQRSERRLDDAIAYWHELVEQRHARGDDEHLRMLRALLEAGVVYGGQAICPFVRPHFVTRAQYTRLEHVCTGFRGALTKLKDAIIAQPALLETLALTDGERRLAAIEPGYTSIAVSMRLDTVVRGHDVRFLELNAEAAAGAHYADAMTSAFAQLSLAEDFRKRFPMSPTPSGADALLASVRAVWQEFGGTGAPRVAVVDWREVSTRSEFDLVVTHLHTHGIAARFVDPRELEFKNDTLSAKGEPIDLVYRRLMTNELLARERECRALIDAVAARRVCMINSFRSKALHKKLVFALLQDDRVARAFTEDERTIVRECVPWTRRVEETHTVDPQGNPVDLVEYVRANRENLVIKPNDEHAGRGVVVGWNVEPAVWEGALAIALSDPSVVQERVRAPKRPFALIEAGQFRVEERYIDLDPYLFRGTLGGVLARLSASTLCNITTGAGSTPTFIVEDA